MITEHIGNIFDSDAQTLIVTVNTVGDMGAGIAKEARLRFPEMAAAYRQQCESGRLTIGRLWLWRYSEPWILCFPTKKHWRHPSRLSYVEAGLEKLVATYQDREITSLAMPHLGAAHGGLDWDSVRPKVYEHLEPLTDLNVHLYEYDPAAHDSAFERLAALFGSAESAHIRRELGLRAREAEVLSCVLRAPPTRSLSALHGARGLGEGSLRKIYDYLFRGSVRRDPPRQLSLHDYPGADGSTGDAQIGCP